MTPRALIASTLRTVLRAVEGSVRPGPYVLPISGGWLPDGASPNFWQLGENVMPLGTSRTAMVEACISAYSQTIAMCPGSHWRSNGKGGRDRVKTSALSRILQHPNAYQSISDFLLNAVRQLYSDGNAYALALRNDRFEISELHLMDARLSKPQLAVTGDVFYRLEGNAVIERQIPGPLVVPQRDVLHLRLHADRNRRYPFPLWGETPLLAAMSDISVGDAINNQQLQFYLNQARPSAVLSTDMMLDKDQVQALRDRWDEQSRGLSQGKTPILTSGLKVQPWAGTPRDAQLAEVMKITEDHIALVFRVPLQILGLGSHTFSSTETLMQFWVATGLGFALNHVEEAFGLLFMLKGQPDEYCEFDTSALLRSAFKDRLEALARGVQGGIYSPNEARNSEGFDKVPFGDSPRVQQQMVPLEAAGKIPAAPGPNAPPAPPPAPPLQPKADPDAIKRSAKSIISRAAAIRRKLD
jgi:HK97 family phage portal protein